MKQMPAVCIQQPWPRATAPPLTSECEIVFELCVHNNKLALFGECCLHVLVHLIVLATLGSPCMGIVLFTSSGFGNDLVDVVAGAVVHVLTKV